MALTINHLHHLCITEVGKKKTPPNIGPNHRCARAIPDAGDSGELINHRKIPRNAKNGNSRKPAKFRISTNGTYQRNISRPTRKLRKLNVSPPAGRELVKKVRNVQLKLLKLERKNESEDKLLCRVFENKQLIRNANLLLNERELTGNSRPLKRTWAFLSVRDLLGQPDEKKPRRIAYWRNGGY